MAGQDLSDEAIRFLLHAVAGPILCFRPREDELILVLLLRAACLHSAPDKDPGYEALSPMAVARLY